MSANRIAKNTLFLYGKLGLTMFVSLYSTRIILNTLGVADFGLFNMIGGSISMLGFLSASMTAATQRFISYAEGEGEKLKVHRIFNVSVVLHVLVAILVLLLYEVCGHFFFDSLLNIPAGRIETAKLIYQFMVVSTVFTVISIPYDAVINAHEHMLLFAIIGIVESVLKLSIAVFIMYLNADKLRMYGLLMAVLSIALLLFRRFYCHYKYQECRIDLKRYFDIKLMREMSGFASWTLLASSSSMIATYGQGLVLNVFFGTVVNAAHGITNQVSGQLSVFSTTMMKALAPVIDKSEGSGNRSLMLKASLVGSKISFFLLALLFIPFLLEMPLIFTLWLKKVPPYTLIFCVLSFSRILFDQLFAPLNSSILAVGNIKNFQLIASVIYLSPIIATIILFQRGFPPFYIYISFIVSSIISAINLIHAAQKYCGLSVDVFLKDVLLRSTGCFALIFIVGYLPHFLLQESIERLMLTLFSSFAAFFIMVYTVGFTPQDRDEVVILAKSIRYSIINRFSKKRVLNS